MGEEEKRGRGESGQTCVSAASVSQSDNFETNAFSYLLSLKASARLAETERELLRICEVNDLHNKNF